MSSTDSNITATVKEFLDVQLSQGRTLETISNEEIVEYLNKYPNLPQKTPRQISAFKANYKRKSLQSHTQVSTHDKKLPNSLECILNVRISKERYVRVIFDEEPNTRDIDRLIQYLEMIKPDFKTDLGEIQSP
jgi:hypothetical protein